MLSPCSGSQCHCSPPRQIVTFDIHRYFYKVFFFSLFIVMTLDQPNARSRKATFPRDRSHTEIKKKKKSTDVRA